MLRSSDLLDELSKIEQTEQTEHRHISDAESNG